MGFSFSAACRQSVGNLPKCREIAPNEREPTRGGLEVLLLKLENALPYLLGIEISSLHWVFEPKFMLVVYVQ